MKLVVGLVLLLMVPLAARAQAAPIPHLKLIAATNYIQALRQRPGRVLDEELVVATARACEGLKELLVDEKLRPILQESSKSSSSHGEVFSAIRGNLAVFVTAFLDDEVKLLERAGLQPQAIFMVQRDGIELKSYYRIGKWDEWVASSFVKELEVFTAEVCTAASSAKALAASRAREPLVRLGRGVGGALVIMADAYFFSANPVVATGSISFGYDIFKDALVK